MIFSSMILSLLFSDLVAMFYDVVCAVCVYAHAVFVCVPD